MKIQTVNITSVDKNVDSYVKISFVPDFERFGLTNLTDDIISLMKIFNLI